MSEPKELVFLTTRESAIAHELADLEGEDDVVGTHGQYHDLMLRMGEAAEVYARASNLGVPEYRALMAEAIRLCRDVRFACDHNSDDANRLNVWRHKPIVLRNLRHTKAHSIDQSSLEQCVGTYLKLPYRSQTMDRLLVDALIGCEALMFAHQMYGAPTVFFLPAPSPILQKHVLISWFFRMIFNIALFGGLAALSFYLGSIGKMGQGWATGVGATLIGLMLLLAGLSTVALPFAWRDQVRARRRANLLMDKMAALYNELGSTGPVSATRTNDLAKSASESGVVWPSSLFPLLEDIIARGGRF